MPKTHKKFLRLDLGAEKFGGLSDSIISYEKWLKLTLQTPMISPIRKTVEILSSCLFTLADWLSVLFFFQKFFMVL